ncbi:MAG: ABC transporter substrate-binding protein [Syntrophomonadaceae bacterium]
MTNIRPRKTIAESLSLLLCLLLAMSALSGCTSKTSTTSTPADQNTRVVTDMAGRKVAIPVKINTVYCAVPTAEAMVYTLAPEKMAAWVNAPADNVKKYLSDRAKSLPVMGGWMGEKCTANLEEITKLAPDLIVFMTTSGVNNNPEQIADSITAQTKRPVVIMDSSLTETAKMYRLMGDILGVQERGEKLASYCEKKMSTINEMVSKVPESKRVRVYYAEGTGGLATDPSGSDHTQVLDFVKGVNVANIQARGGTGMATVSMEQVLSWNPEIVLVSSSTGGDKNYQIILTEPSWSQITAVKNGKVYLTPLLPFGWFDRPPNVTRIIGVQWLASVLYPEYVKIDLNQEVKEFFALYYNQNLTDEQVKELLKNAVPK